MAAGQGGRYYVEQIREMQEFEYTVLYVDFSHLLEREEVLANAIQTQYYRQVDSHPLSPECPLILQIPTLPQKSRSIYGSKIRKFLPIHQTTHCRPILLNSLIIRPTPSSRILYRIPQLANHLWYSRHENGPNWSAQQYLRNSHENE